MQKKRIKLLLFLSLTILLLPNLSIGAPLTVDDIPKAHWGKKYIDIALTDGWGYVSNGKFNPDEPATREHVIYMIMSIWNKAEERGKTYGRLITTNLDLNAYSDGDIVSDDTKVEFQKGVMNYIIKGYEDGTLKPQGKITRAEMATLINRVANVKLDETIEVNYKDKIPAWANEAIINATKAGLVKGYETGKFMPSNNVTNAEVVTMLARWVYSESLES